VNQYSHPSVPNPVRNGESGPGRIVLAKCAARLGTSGSVLGIRG